MKNSLPCLLLLLLLVLGLHCPALAKTTPPTGRPLAEALNPDGTLKSGANGSFDARQFRMGTAPNGRPVFRPAGTKGAGDERWADGFGLPNGVDGVVYAVAQVGINVYVGGRFKAVGGIVAANIAVWNGSGWRALGSGTSGGYGNGTVYALTVSSSGMVYVGGTFGQAGSIATSGVAQWNGISWASLGTGLNSMSSSIDGVFSLALAGNGDLYVGGTFYQAGGQATNSVAKWNGMVWSPLGTGTTNGAYDVHALAVAANGDVYAGGSFTQAGGATANGVARWNGTAWSSLGTGTTNGVSSNTSYSLVNTLAVAGNGDVYVGGQFTQAGGLAANNVAKWNGTAWSSLGTGVSGVRTFVYALVVSSNGDVYVGGNFTQAGGVAVSHVAKWNGTVWSGIGTGTTNGVSGSVGYYPPVSALAVSSTGDLYVGGDFTQAGGVAANNVVKWSGAVWNSIGTNQGLGLNGTVRALAVASNGDVYVGGQFTQAGGITANSVAKWNGTAWTSLGTGPANGVSGGTGSSLAYVYALAVAGNGDVYVGGSFTQAGSVAANNVAKWDGTNWSSLGTGVSSQSSYTTSVYTLAVASNGEIFAGGRFQQAGTTPANNIARWNGQFWSALGTVTSNGITGYSVYALAFAGSGDLYVVGDFQRAGGIVAYDIAIWNGTAWNPVGQGISSSTGIHAIKLTSTGDVYVAGYFPNGVSKWNGTTWSSLGTGTANGVNNVANTLVIASNGDVYVSGFFTQAGGTPAGYVAVWNGTAWQTLGTGINNSGYALAFEPAGKMYVGGDFNAVGDGSKAMSHFSIYDPAVPLATSAAAKATPAALFPNPAHGTATLRLPAGAPRQALTLTDTQGRLVRRYPAPATADAELDLRGLPAGVYVVRCGEFTQRLVVE